MRRVVVGVALRDRLGEDGARGLDEYVESAGEVWRTNVINACTDRFDARLQECAKPNEMNEGFARIVNQLADTRVEILRWSFAFWLGQVAVIVAFMAFIARVIGS